MRKVCLVGFAPQTRELANSQPEDVELWGMNISHTFMKRWDRWFQLHPWEGGGLRGDGQYGRDEDHVEFLKTCDVPLYMNDPQPDMPTAIQYPYEEVASDLGRDYLTSSSACAIALAIHEGVDELRVVGVNAATELEYVQQRPGIEYLLGVAEGRGIRVWLPPATTLLKGRRYPLGPSTEEDMLQERLDHSRLEYMKLHSEIYQLIGAFKGLRKAGLAERTRGIKGQLIQKVMELQKTRGKLDSDLYYLRHLGGTDVGSTTLPEMDIPAEMMEGVEDLLPDVREIDLPIGHRVA